MKPTYIPPGITSLTEIDIAPVTYESHAVEIHGIVSPGQGGWSGKKDSYKVHCLSFAAWQPDGEPLRARKLTILRPVPSDVDYFDDFPEFTIQHFRVILSTDKERAIFVQSLPIESPHASLTEFAAEYKKPVILSTKRFGELVLDLRIDRFEGTAEWNGQKVGVSFTRDENGSIENAMKTADTLWNDQNSWQNRIEAFTLQELLPVKNDCWLDEDEAELTSEQFVSRMTLESISLQPDGEFEFWHDDGDLFYGHSIQVSGNLRDGPTDADIPG